MQESLGSKFRRQLHVLMAAISKTEVQYVRCIKPNKIKSSKVSLSYVIVSFTEVSWVASLCSPLLH